MRSAVTRGRCTGGSSVVAVCAPISVDGACCGRLAEREEIAIGLARDESAAAIAGRLGGAVSTVTRDVNLNGGRRGYRAHVADMRALERARRPKRAKLARSPRLRVEVERRLGERWSPEQIAARLRVDFPDDAEMRVSHETI